MIIKLQGGLGNQMFQYAYGRSHGAQFDATGLPLGNPPRQYGLGAWDLPIELVDGPGERIAGYWQAEKHFNVPVIRCEFRRPKGEIPKHVLEAAGRIYPARNSCFIGVRRSDYLWPERINYHGVMPLSYYQEALKLVPDGKRFIFTDDIPWCKEFLPEFEVMDVNGPNEKHWDIWLMSLFEHAIIANSSFHWWGAFLGPDRRGKVIAPKQWFINGMATEIVPERWISI